MQMRGNDDYTIGGDDMVNIENNTVNTVTNTVVKVDYIEGEYESNEQDGFKKKRPAGYNGSKAGGPHGPHANKQRDRSEKDNGNNEHTSLLSMMNDKGPHEPMTDEQV